MLSSMILKQRSKKGQAVALPMVILALTITVSIGLLSFEVARTAIARDQLHTATEAAALAGAATMAGSASTDITTTQQNAIKAAKAMFRQNEIFGQSLAAANEGAGNPGAGAALLSFQFLDPANNNAEVPAGDPKGKELQVTAVYGLPALDGKVIGLGTTPVPLSAKAAGGVGELDVVLCFDCSTSMRFNTFTTQVKRTFDGATGKITYPVAASRSFSPDGGMLPELISSLNAPLRGANDNSAPGNFPPGVAPNSGFTDTVANFDEKTNFSGFSDGGFDFPNVAALVEASRGNLENEAVFESSGASTALKGVVLPKAGYKTKYFELARKHSHPWIEAQTAAQNFFTLMNNNTRAHFGFVAFSHQVGQDANAKFNENNVGFDYPAGGVGSFALPAISLNPAEGQTNFAEIEQAVSDVVPDGGTNIGGAIERATRMFDNNQSRPNAKKAIILFTDGIPSVGLPLDGNPITNCQKAAQIAHNKGIAVFGVGLALDPSLLQEQGQVLNLITTTAGNGGKFFQVTDASKLNSAFGSIARNLTQIVQ